MCNCKHEKFPKTVSGHSNTYGREQGEEVYAMYKLQSMLNLEISDSSYNN